MDDLARATQAAPDKPAIISYAAGSLARVLSYRELAVLVDRFAAAIVVWVGRGRLTVAELTAQNRNQALVVKGLTCVGPMARHSLKVITQSDRENK